MNDGGNDGLEDWQCLMWPPQFLPIYKLLGDVLDGYRWQVPPRCLTVLHCLTSVRTITPDETEDPLEHDSDTPDALPSPPNSKAHSRKFPTRRMPRVVDTRLSG